MSCGSFAWEPAESLVMLACLTLMSAQATAQTQPHRTPGTIATGQIIGSRYLALVVKREWGRATFSGLG